MSAPALPTLSSGTLVLDIDPSRMTGYAQGDVVTQLDDFSGNAFHATQATAAARGTWQAALLNGYPAVRFDGVDDSYKTPNVGSSYDRAVFAVLARNSTVKGKRPIDADTSRRTAIWSGTTANKWATFAGGTAIESANDIDTLWHAFVAWGGVGLGWNFKTDGQAAVPTTDPTQNLGYFNIGCNNSSSYADFDFVRLVVYEGSITEADTVLLDKYAQDTYGITVADYPASGNLNRLKIGSTQVAGLYIGSTAVAAAYVGTTQVWP